MGNPPYSEPAPDIFSTHPSIFFSIENRNLSPTKKKNYFDFPKRQVTKMCFIYCFVIFFALNIAFFSGYIFPRLMFLT